MSTAAASKSGKGKSEAKPGESKSVDKSADAKSNKPGQYEVGRPGSKCFVCNEDLLPGAKVMATLRETPAGFERLDISLHCWPQFDRQGLLAFWQTVIPHHEAKKKLFVDDEVLCELFEH